MDGSGLHGYRTVVSGALKGWRWADVVGMCVVFRSLVALLGELDRRAWDVQASAGVPLDKFVTLKDPGWHSLFWCEVGRQKQTARLRTLGEGGTRIVRSAQGRLG